MNNITALYHRLVLWYGALAVNTVLVLFVLLILLAVVGAIRSQSSDDTVDDKAQTIVTLARVSDIGNSQGTFTVLGTVSAVTEARLETEASGRITSVSVSLGDSVRAGQTLATIENSRERAVVLQAQGAYESALANVNAGGASIDNAEKALDEARISAMNTYRSAYTTVDGVVRGTLDTFYSDPNGTIPGLLIDGQGRATSLSTERVAIRAMLESWSTAALSQNMSTDLDVAENNTRRVSTLLATIATLYAEDKNLAPQLEGLTSSLAGARAQLDGALASISGARSGLNQAENALTQARISGQSGTASAADAQVKQALGALRLAQANLEKTIIRTPISGTVQSLTVKEGTTVGMNAPAAIVSSEGSLEIVAYVTETDARTIEVGAPVTIEGGSTGIVTEIASAVDPLTKKVEFRVGVNETVTNLVNGQSVRVSLRTAGDAHESAELTLPIISLKMTPDGAVVFTVEDGQLVSHLVTLGAIRGDRVVVKDGIDTSWELVTDARGLRAGETVEVK